MNNQLLSLKGFPTINFLLVGVGGQGTILASNILAEVGLRTGFDVKQAEVHGMSQRGGSVVSNMRWAKQVFSPIIPKGEADILIAFEKLEAARFADFLRPDGLMFINDYSIVPVTVSAGDAIYPSDEALRQNLSTITAHTCWVPGVTLAEELGNPKTANIIVLGAVSAWMDIPLEDWMAVVEARVPKKHLAINQKAFLAGRETALNQ